jgi:hypothetical protein
VSVCNLNTWKVVISEHVFSLEVSTSMKQPLMLNHESSCIPNPPKGLQIPLIENLASHQGTYDTLNLTDNSLTILGNIPLCELLPSIFWRPSEPRKVASWDPIWREVSERTRCGGNADDGSQMMIGWSELRSDNGARTIRIVTS